MLQFPCHPISPEVNVSHQIMFRAWKLRQKHWAVGQPDYRSRQVYFTRFLLTVHFLLKDPQCLSLSLLPLQEYFF